MVTAAAVPATGTERERGLEPVRIGVVGCGNVALGSYLPYLRRLNLEGYPNVVVAGCDIDERCREEMRDRFGVERFTTDYREVVADPEVELVLVLAAMPVHGEVTRAALEAGKHVLVEKPMAMTLAEAAGLVELAKQSPGLLVPAPHVVLSPTYQAIWWHLQRGDIGQVMTARGFYGWSGPYWGPWYYRPGGGSMFDLGVYNVTTLTGLLGPVQRVMAMSGVAIPERVIEGERVPVESHDNAHLLLDFGDARYAVVTTGFTIQRYRNAGIELYGTEGTIQMQREDWAPEGYELWRNEAGCWQIYEQGYWPWMDGVRHLLGCIRAGTRPLITPEHAYHVLEIMLKSMESGDTGQALPIASRFEPPRFDPEPAEDAAAHLDHDPSRDR